MLIGNRDFQWGRRTYVMGVVNVTPDSFSGDGTLVDSEGVRRSVEQALRFEDEGADIIDVGGESTRPPAFYRGAKPVDAAEELQRVIPVIEALTARLGVPVSIDTRKAAVARAAVKSGAAVLNDVSMLADPDMAPAAAETGMPIVISHIRPQAVYEDPVEDVASDLAAAIGRAEAAGVRREKIIADPGIGFGKRPVHSLAVLRGLDRLKERLGVPLLVGTSRKSFIGAVLDLPVEDRLEGTAATVALAIASGVDIVRVHDVREMTRVARMADAVVRGWTPPDSP